MKTLRLAIWAVALIVLTTSSASAAIIAYSSVVVPQVADGTIDGEEQKSVDLYSLSYTLLITSNTGQTGTALAPLNVGLQGTTNENPTGTYFFSGGRNYPFEFSGFAHLTVSVPGWSQYREAGAIGYAYGASPAYCSPLPFCRPSDPGNNGYTLAVPFTFGVPETIVLSGFTEAFFVGENIPLGTPLPAGGATLYGSVAFSGITGVYDHGIIVDFPDTNVSIELTAIPEPSTFSLYVGMVLCGLAFKMRRKVKDRPTGI